MKILKPIVMRTRWYTGKSSCGRDLPLLPSVVALSFLFPFLDIQLFVFVSTIYPGREVGKSTLSEPMQWVWDAIHAIG